MERACLFSKRSASGALTKVAALGLFLLRVACWNGFGAAIPVSEMGSLTVTHLQSDRNSGLIYAISEPPGQPALLLEVDSLTETVLRVTEVGSSVTDLEIHYPENRIYIPNWRPGLLRAIDRSSFQTVQTYDFNPFTVVSEGDVYSVSAGIAGRLVVEEENQHIQIRLLDTGSGEIIAKTLRNQGGGSSSADGRFYYHGDNNSTGAGIVYYDLSGDSFRVVKSIRPDGLRYTGSRTVSISEDGARIFWANYVLDDQLNVLWNTGDHVYGCTTTGRYAMSAATIYDVPSKEAVLAMPAHYAPTAYNSTSEKLIVGMGNSLKFFSLPENEHYSMPAPVVSAEIERYLNVVLTWTDQSLETEFIIQSQKTGDLTWDTVNIIGGNRTSYKIWKLEEETDYTFRIRATSGAISSGWSEPVSITTTYFPPRNAAGRVKIQNPFDLLIEWNKVDVDFVHFEVKQMGASGEEKWTEIATTVGSRWNHQIKNLQPGTSYEFRMRSEREGRFSVYWYFTGTTLALQSPSKPVFQDVTIQAPGALWVEWGPVSFAQELILSSRLLGETEFVEVARLEGDQTSFLHSGLNPEKFYTYQLLAVNAMDKTLSESTAPESPTMLLVFEDDFEKGPRSDVWGETEASINWQGGPTGSGFAQFFSGVQREIVTHPLKLYGATQIEFDLLLPSKAHYVQLGPIPEEFDPVSVEMNTGSGWVPLGSYDLIEQERGWYRFLTSSDFTDAFGETRLRWIQHGIEQGRVSWGLDNVRVSAQRSLPPPAPKLINVGHSDDGGDIVSWLKSNRANIYSVERSLDEEHSWEMLGTTKELSFTAPKTIEGQVVGYRVAAQNDSGTSGFSQTLWSGKPNTVTVSGRVFFLGRKERPIQHATVTLTQDGKEQQTSSDRQGHYQFEIPPGKPVDIRAELINYSKPNRGVDVADLIGLRTHILNRSRFGQPVEWLAADVNRDGSVDVSDIVQMRKVILNRDNAFSRDQKGNKHSFWQLVCADFIGVNAENILIEFPNYTVCRYDQVTADISSADFAAIKLGDSNGDWTLEE